MKRLDNDQLMEVLDREQMMEYVTTMDQQVLAAIRIGQEATLRVIPSSVRNIIFAGAGGSIVVGDLIRNYGLQACPLPITSCRAYDLPRHVGPDSLVFVTSYSGNSEETIRLYEQAKSAGAQRIVLSSGGELRDRALVDGVTYVQIPSKIQPRGAVGYLFFPLYVLMVRLGFLPDLPDELYDVAKTLHDLRLQVGPDVPEVQNIAKQLASSLVGTLPLIVGSNSMLEGVALRWKQQVNENSKAVAYTTYSLPWQAQEVEGLRIPRSISSCTHWIVLTIGFEEPTALEAMERLQEMADAMGVPITRLPAAGHSRLARMWYHLNFSDYVTTYLAYAYGFDPSAIKYIHYVKQQLP